MSDQLLSTDPSAGLLSTDPNAAAPARSKGHDFKVLGVNIHVPGEEQPRTDANVIGWGSEGAGIAPEELLVAGQAVRGVARAASGGVLAGAKQFVAEVNPVLKFEVTRVGLEQLGVPPKLAVLAAMAISGHQRNGKKVAAEAEAVNGVPRPADMNAPHLDRSVPVRPSQLTPQQMAERYAYGHGTPPPTRRTAPVTRAAAPPETASAPIAEAGANPSFEVVRDEQGNIASLRRIKPSAASAPPPAAPPVVPEPPVAATGRTAAPPPIEESPPSVRPANTLPDQKALNEEALARRRAEYQARVKAEAETAAPAKFVPTPAETKEYMRLIKAGKSHAEAGRAIVAQRLFQEQYGLSTPTAAETTFPKGMRGKSVSPREPQ